MRIVRLTVGESPVEGEGDAIFEVSGSADLVKQGETGPAGKSKVWSGVMVIEGTSESVVGYRATAA